MLKQLPTCLLCLLLASQSLAAILVSEQADVHGDAAPAYCDIVAARVWQMDDDHYQLEIEVAGDIPRLLDPDEYIRFMWYLDVDQNPQTGQAHGANMGSEFNVRCYQTEKSSLNYGVIDIAGGVIAPGGRITKFITGKTAIMLLPFDRISNETIFNWKCSIVTGSGGLEDDIDSIALASPSVVPFPNVTPERVVLEEHVPLRNGRVSGAPQLYMQNCDGYPIGASADTIVEYYSYYDRLDIQNGVLSARPGQFRSTPVAARVNGRLSDNLVEVTSGSLWIDPPILHLDLESGGQATGNLTVRARDASGMDVALDSLDISWDNPSMVWLQPSAVPHTAQVTALSENTGRVTIRAVVDGITSRAGAHVRVTPTHFDFILTEYAGQHVVFSLPGAQSFSHTGITLDEMVSDFQVVEASDVAVELEYLLTGTRYADAERQFFNAVVRDEAGTYCGASGNPITLGFDQGDTYPFSCIQLDDTGYPRWNTYFHECGHNTVATNSLLGQYLQPSSSPFVGGVFGEGNANLCALYVMYNLIADPGLANLSSIAVESLNNTEWSGGGFRGRRGRYLADLADYENSPVPDNIDANIMDGMFAFLCEQYGWDRLPRFYSIFLPPTEELTFDPTGYDETFITACFSAAFRVDLRVVFRDRWGFTIDETYYATILPESQKRAALRDTPQPADFDLDGDVDEDDFGLFQACMTGPALGPPSSGCHSCDFDRDYDVDQSDFGAFQRCLGGSNVLATPSVVRRK